MKSINRNKIVRTIRKYKGKDQKFKSHEIDFMTFSEYDAKSEYKFIDGNIEIYPYKWFDIRKFYQIPAYWFLSLINKLFKNTIQINKRNHNVASTITLISQIVILAKTLVVLFK
jgi:hypothetical protein